MSDTESKALRPLKTAPARPSSPGLVPLNPNAPFARALALHRQGKIREAELLCIEIVKRRPKHFGALSLLGAIALSTRRNPRAVQMLRRAIALNPNLLVAHNNLGEALRRLKRPKLALESFNKAIALKPNDANAYINKANLFYELKRYPLALAIYDKAIALNPELARAYFNRGNTQREMKRPQAALESYRRAISLVPGFVRAHTNLGALLNELERCEEALQAYDAALALRPKSPACWYNHANVLRDLNRIDDAIASYHEAIALKSDYAQAHWNMGNCMLLLGDYGQGLTEYEHRLGRARQIKRRAYSQPVWTGDEDIAGKTLFIFPEFYLGDMIEFCRYAKMAEDRGAKVVLAAQNSLHQLLRGLSPTLEIIAADAVPDNFDYHCPLMSLPFAFKTTFETIPGQVPYLLAEEERVVKWREKLGPHGIKIGICWQGSKTVYAQRLHRSFSPLHFRNIAKLANVRLISLQKPDGEDPLAGLPSDLSIESLGPEFDAGPQAFLDTAAVMQSLDLVITTDTGLAHLAGALARPTWLVVKHVPDWRWLLDRADSPWYPTMRLFRQKQRGNWRSAFEQIETALAAEFQTSVSSLA
jgi:tetratricopeptide (TPR) repeat protein